MKYTIDIALIRGKMYEKKYTNTFLAKELGISRNTLNTYFKRPEMMPYGVISKMIEKLDYKKENITDIFFKN